MLASSNGASTSSKIQNGAGFNKYRANSKAVAVKVFSPPDSCERDLGFLPLGLAMISIFDSKGLSSSSRIRLQLSSSVNNERNTLMKFSLICSKAFINCFVAVCSISLIVSRSESLAMIISSRCVEIDSYRSLISLNASTAKGFISPKLASLFFSFSTFSCSSSKESSVVISSSSIDLISTLNSILSLSPTALISNLRPVYSSRKFCTSNCNLLSTLFLTFRSSSFSIIKLRAV